MPKRKPTADETKRQNGLGSVYAETIRGTHGQPDRTRWRAQAIIDGKKVRRNADTKAAAERILLELHRDAARDRIVVNGNMSLADLLERWRTRDAPAGRSERTLAVHDWSIEILTEQIGTRRIADLTSDDVWEVYERLATGGRDGSGSRPMSRASLLKVNATLRLALDFAERREYVRRNVATHVKMPTAARPTERGRSLTVAEARQFLAAVEGHRLAALFRLMLATGLRIGEATGLTWDDIDTGRRVVHVRRQLKVIRGRLELSDQLKTEGAFRSIDIDAGTAAALADHRDRQDAEREHAGALWSNAPGLVFTTALGAPLNPTNVRRQLDVITDRAGLPRIKPHSLRHSAASIMAASGVSILDAADVLGHRGVRMLTEVYRHQLAPTAAGALAIGAALDAAD